MNLLQVTRLSEEEARIYIESILWPDGPICPHCGNCENIYPLKGKTTRPGLYKCGACRKPFTVRVKSIMQGTHVGFREWAVAFHLMCSSKKGMSALQLQRELGIGQYKTAWFLAHRIRSAMEKHGFLSGTVEVDETYVGGKPRKDGTKHKRGRGTDKTPVVAMVSREGQAQAHPVDMVNGETLKTAMTNVILPDSRIMTDEFPAYRGACREYPSHQTVNHSEGEYSRGEVHVNNTESYFSLLKRGVHGTFHHVSKKHLGRYCHEFSFRWNRRKITDGERCRKAIGQMHGKRLVYKQLTEKAQ